MARKRRQPPDPDLDLEAFEAWVRYTFDRSSEELTKPVWYHRIDNPPTEWELRYAAEINDPVATAIRIRHLFSNSGALLQGFSDDQVGHGLSFIVDGSLGGEIHVLGNRDVPPVLRITGLRSIVTLFREVFAARLSADGAVSRQLDYICFMFWDVANLAYADGETVLDVLEQTLALGSEPCQRAALHGLGHEYWSTRDRGHVTDIVDRWLTRNPRVAGALRDYAERAQIGDVM